METPKSKYQNFESPALSPIPFNSTNKLPNNFSTRLNSIHEESKSFSSDDSFTNLSTPLSAKFSKYVNDKAEASKPVRSNINYNDRYNIHPNDQLQSSTSVIDIDDHSVAQMLSMNMINDSIASRSLSEISYLKSGALLDAPMRTPKKMFHNDSTDTNTTFSSYPITELSYLKISPHASSEKRMDIATDESINGLSLLHDSMLSRSPLRKFLPTSFKVPHSHTKPITSLSNWNHDDIKSDGNMIHEPKVDLTQPRSLPGDKNYWINYQLNFMEDDGNVSSLEASPYPHPSTPPRKLPPRPFPKNSFKSNSSVTSELAPPRYDSDSHHVRDAEVSRRNINKTGEIYSSPLIDDYKAQASKDKAMGTGLQSKSFSGSSNHYSLHSPLHLSKSERTAYYMNDSTPIRSIMNPPDDLIPNTTENILKHLRFDDIHPSTHVQHNRGNINGKGRLHAGDLSKDNDSFKNLAHMRSFYTQTDPVDDHNNRSLPMDRPIPALEAGTRIHTISTQTNEEGIETKMYILDQSLSSGHPMLIPVELKLQKRLQSDSKFFHQENAYETISLQNLRDKNQQHISNPQQCQECLERKKRIRDHDNYASVHSGTLMEYETVPNDNFNERYEDDRKIHVMQQNSPKPLISSPNSAFKVINNPSMKSTPTQQLHVIRPKPNLVTPNSETYSKSSKQSHSSNESLHCVNNVSDMSNRVIVSEGSVSRGPPVISPESSNARNDMIREDKSKEKMQVDPTTDDESNEVQGKEILNETAVVIHSSSQKYAKYRRSNDFNVKSFSDYKKKKYQVANIPSDKMVSYNEKILNSGFFKQRLFPNQAYPRSDGNKYSQLTPERSLPIPLDYIFVEDRRRLSFT